MAERRNDDDDVDLEVFNDDDDGDIDLGLEEDSEDIEDDRTEENASIAKRKINSDDNEDFDNENQSKKSQVPNKKKAKFNAGNYFDNEAEESGAEEGDADDQMEEDEKDDYIRDGFVVDEVDEEDDVRVTKTKNKKDFQRLKKKRELRLEDDDLALIAENNNDRNRNQYNNFSSDEIVPERIRANNQSSLEKNLFDDDDDDNEDNRSRPYKTTSSYVEENYDSDDMNDFLVDDIVEEDDDDITEHAGTNKLERRQVKRNKELDEHEGPSRAQLDEAFDIFGDGFEDMMGDKEMDEDLLAEPGAVSEQEKLKSIRAQYERSVLIESFCTERDDHLRRTDKPERYLEIFDVRTPPEDVERSEEAQWIASKLAPSMLNKDKDPTAMDVNVDAEELQLTLKSHIESVLRFMQIDLLEAPFIWRYRKDYLHPQMTNKHIWQIQSYDEQWESIMSRRNILLQELEAINTADKFPAIDEDKEFLILANEISTLEESQEDLRVQVDQSTELLSIEKSSLEDEDDDITPSDKLRIDRAEIRLQELLKQQNECTILLEKKREELQRKKSQRKLRSKYSNKVANAVKGLFPMHRYESIILSTHDEQELRDLQNFFVLIVRGAEEEEVADNLAAAAAAAQQQLLEGGESNLTKKVKELEIDTKIDNNNLRKLRRVGDRDNYRKARKIQNIRTLVKKFSIQIYDLGDAIRNGAALKREPPTPPFLPDEVAQQFLEKHTQVTLDTENLLLLTRTMLAIEIAAEPSIRKAARELYRRKVTLSTKPTPLGIETITPFHNLFGLHVLVNKPISDFLNTNNSTMNTMYALLVKAETDGLIIITINYSTDDSSNKLTYNSTTTNDTTNNKQIEWKSFLNDFGLLDLYQPSIKPYEDDRPIVRTAWDSEREKIIQEAIQKYLLPQLEVELRRYLVKISREAIIEEAANNFTAMLSMGPYRNPVITAKDILSKCPQPPNLVNVVCIYLPSEHRDAIYMVHVDTTGVLRRHDLIPSSAIHQKKEKMKEFLMKTKPHVVVINTSGGLASKSTHNMIKKYLLNEIDETIRQAARERREERRERMDFSRYEDDEEELVKFDPEVILVRDDVATIFKNSKRSKKMFPELQPGTAAAVCLARFIQEPIAEYTNMWHTVDSVGTFGSELTFLELHPLKNLLAGSKQGLLKALEKCLIDAVCNIGVDLNQCINHDHKAGMLAFVAGLGLRKADHIRQNVKRVIVYVESRRELLERKLMGKIVFTNAAGFLRICDDSLDRDRNFDPLDDTRIHTECYITNDFAPKICADALEVAHSAEQYRNTVIQIMENSHYEFEKLSEEEIGWPDLYLEDPNKVKELPDKLSELELEDYARDLESLGKGKRFLQLLAIKDELRFPWLDKRPPLSELTPNELFSIFTGESDSTLHIGQQITCKVVEIREKSINVNIDGGILQGFVKISNLCEHRVEDINDVIKVGENKIGVILQIMKDQFRVEVSFKDEHVKRGEDWWIANRNIDENMAEWCKQTGKGIYDDFFDELKALSYYIEHTGRLTLEKEEKKGEVEERMERIKRLQHQVKQRTRICFHPAYKQCKSYKEAEEELRGKGAGAVLFRASSKGGLSITWAFQESWFKHIDVDEIGRDPENMAIGNKLCIKGNKEIYSSLDEVIAMYIDPMNEYVDKMVSYRSFMSGAVDVVQSALREEWKNNNSRIPYKIRFEPDKPGYFVLTWFVSGSTTNPFKVEYIAVISEGYRVRDSKFTSPSAVVAWFKSTVGSGQDLGGSNGSSGSGGIGASTFRQAGGAGGSGTGFPTSSGSGGWGNIPGSSNTGGGISLPRGYPVNAMTPAAIATTTVTGPYSTERGSTRWTSNIHADPMPVSSFPHSYAPPPSSYGTYLSNLDVAQTNAPAPALAPPKRFSIGSTGSGGNRNAQLQPPPTHQFPPAPPSPSITGGGW